MAQFPYPVHVVVDDDGAIVPGATVTVASVVDKDDAPIASHGATVSLAGAKVCVNYDPETKGDAWVTLAVSKSGSTFTGLNAAPCSYLTRDAQRIGRLLFTATDEVRAKLYEAGVAVGPSAGDPTEDEWASIKTTLGVNGTATPTAPTAGPLKTIDDLIDTEVATLATGLGTVATNVASILSSILAAQDAAAVTAGGTTTITVSGVATDLRPNLVGKWCHVLTSGGAFKDRQKIATRTAAGSTDVLTFATAFATAVSTTDTVVIM